MTEIINSEIPGPVITTTQIDENTIEVSLTTPESVEVNQYNYNFLVQQAKNIQADLDRYTAARMAELAEVNNLLAQFPPGAGNINVVQ